MTATLRVDEISSPDGIISISSGQILDISKVNKSITIPQGSASTQGTPTASGIRYNSTENLFSAYGKSWNKFKKIIVNDYNNLFAPGLIFEIDAQNLDSYPGSSTIWYDLSKKKNNVTLENGVAFSSFDPKTFTFNGSTHRGRMQNILLGNGNLEWTATAWIKTTTTVDALGQGSILSNASGGPVYSMMGVNQGKIVYWTYQNSAWAQKLGTKIINDGQWHFLTWVNYNNFTMSMFVDGVFDSNVANSASGNNNPIDILGASWAAYFSGSISYVSIYNRALTTNQISQNFNALRNRYGI